MNLSLTSNDYFLDMLRQPEALRATLAAFETLDFDEFQLFSAGLASGALKRVVLTGMGSSYHALHPLHLRLTAAGITSQMCETSELIHYAPRLLNPESLVVAVSQSGRSAETLQLLEEMRGRVPCIGLTNTPGSPLELQTSAALVTRAGSEFSVSCKTYVTALAGLALLGDLLCDTDPRATLAACHSAAQEMERYLSGWQSLVDAAMQEMPGVQDLILAGRGPSLAAVGTGGLIIKEAAHFHSEGMSSAAFRHGPLEMASEALYVLVYEGLEPTRLLNANLVEDIHKVGGRAALLGRASGVQLFQLPPVPDAALPLVEILPAQILSLALALLRGHNPGYFERGSKVTIIA